MLRPPKQGSRCDAQPQGVTRTGMELSDNTHHYACSTCGHTGSVCLEALWLAQAFCRAQREVDHILPDSFEMLTASEFHGCGQPCNVLLRVRRGEIEVTVGMRDSCDEMETLEPAASVTARRQPALAAGTLAAQEDALATPLRRAMP